MVRYRATVMDHLGPVYPTVNGMLDGVASRVASSKVASRMASRVASSVASSVAVVNRAQRSLAAGIIPGCPAFCRWLENELEHCRPCGFHSPYLAPAGADVRRLRACFCCTFFPVTGWVPGRGPERAQAQAQVQRRRRHGNQKTRTGFCFFCHAFFLCRARHPSVTFKHLIFD